MRVVIAPDSFGGTLTAQQAAEAIATGWARTRPHDELVLLGMSDGGEGLLDVVGAADPGLQHHEVEVAGPRGLPVTATWLGGERVAVVESAQACGLSLLAPGDRDPLLTTTHGVGELLESVRATGVRRILVGLGGSATVDGGAGALTGLGMRLRRADGSGVKVGGGWVGDTDRVEPGWIATEWDDVTVDLLADVTTPLADAAAVFGPQKGADEQAVATLAAGMDRWAAVVERDLDRPGLARRPGTGAAGGLAFGLAAALGGTVKAGAPVVADLVGLDAALRDADFVVTGEGRVDATSHAGKVVSEIAQRAHTFDVDWALVAGGGAAPQGVVAEWSAPDGPGTDPAGEVASAGARLAARFTDGGASPRA
ncbi:glycerate kinase [Salsipaludibacter albus]|uniref:glycerate kinase n=1 Tax=Salsipaludibacter albus TaxID=2849650 RepID=UPI001EE3B7D4|nr:glycerate kinase [Salsipaludibacter albus]MBY5164448.1 glycerate kinase [Salsipaludibacter albus]